jgi:excisionase family DNA binding protein
MSDSNEGMTSLNDFCRRNSVGRSYVYQQIKEGKLKAIKVGAHTRITYEDERTWRQSLPKLETAAIAA